MPDTEIILSTKTNGQLTAVQQINMNKSINQEFGVLKAFSNFQIRKSGSYIYVDKGYAYVGGALVENEGINFYLSTTASYYDIYIRVEYGADYTGEARVFLQNVSTNTNKWIKRTGTVSNGTYVEYQLGIISNTGILTQVAQFVPQVIDIENRLSTLEQDTGWIEVPVNATNYKEHEDYPIKIRRIGKIVHLQLHAKTSQNIVSGGLAQVCVIPEQFRPSNAIRSANGTVSTSKAYTLWEFEVRGGGAVNARCNNNALTANVSVWAYITWMVD